MTPAGGSAGNTQTQIAPPAINAATGTPPPATPVDQPKTKIKFDFIKFGLSLILALVSYWFFWWLLSSHGVNPLFSHLVGCLLGLLLLAYIDSLSQSTLEMSKPVLILMLLLLICNLAIIYLPGYGKADKNVPEVVASKVFKSETLVFFGKERRIAKIKFPVGKEYRMTVYGGTVNIEKRVGLEEFKQEEGTCLFTNKFFANIILWGTGTKSTVLIEWEE